VISRQTSSSVRPCAISSSGDGMSMPYTFGNFTGGAAEAKITRLAPASRAICTISRRGGAVARWSRRPAACDLPLNSDADRVQLLAHRLLAHRLAGQMKVRPG
jgi:hypothetical protein